MEKTCENEKCGCSSEENCQCSGEGSCCGGNYDKTDMFMYLAHSAKMELIKDKMKKKLEATQGKKLDKIADLFVDAMMEKWKDKAELSRKKEELMAKLESIFMEG